MVQTDELLKPPKRQTYLISPTSREIEDFEKTFLLTKRRFHFSGNFTDWTDSRLKSDCKKNVQTEELLKTPKKQTSHINYISRNRRLLEKTFFTDKEKFQVFWKVTILVISRVKSD